MGSFSFSFRHHSNVIRMGHHNGKGIYGNKTEELILNLILTPFLCHSYGIQFRKVYIREQDRGELTYLMMSNIFNHMIKP